MNKEARNEYFKAKNKEDIGKCSSKGKRSKATESVKRAKIETILNKPKEKQTDCFQIG